MKYNIWTRITFNGIFSCILGELFFVFIFIMFDPIATFWNRIVYKMKQNWCFGSWCLVFGARQSVSHFVYVNIIFFHQMMRHIECDIMVSFLLLYFSSFFHYWSYYHIYLCHLLLIFLSFFFLSIFWWSFFFPRVFVILYLILFCCWFFNISFSLNFM